MVSHISNQPKNYNYGPTTPSIGGTAYNSAGAPVAPFNGLAGPSTAPPTDNSQVPGGFSYHPSGPSLPTGFAYHPDSPYPYGVPLTPKVPTPAKPKPPTILQLVEAAAPKAARPVTGPSGPTQGQGYGSGSSLSAVGGTSGSTDVNTGINLPI
jgi:hypothetical protein